MALPSLFSSSETGLSADPSDRFDPSDFLVYLFFSLVAPLLSVLVLLTEKQINIPRNVPVARLTGTK